ncbi:MAG: fasciclin domain-containing protein [Gammaproteobacteria bacterium]|nr:fasciclin domain-containing protein [Gammaproteobacteria bacterium]
MVGVASSAGSFNTLITAVKAAGLLDTLSGEGPYTVFAPTDAAFAKLPEGTLDALLADKSKLTEILTYHVVPGRVDAAAVSGVSKLSTVQGSELPVADIKIAKTDVKASNGVIHVIDEVLIPDV